MISAHPLFAPRLLSTRALAPGVRLLRFASWPGFAFTPGQFVVLLFSDEPKIRRAYSLCSAPAEAGAYFEIAVASAGDFSERLIALRPGAEGHLVARGPFGKWTWDGSGHAVLASSGTGIAPFRAMALLDQGKVTLCYSATAQSELLFHDEYETWRKSGVDVKRRMGNALWQGRYKSGNSASFD